MVFSEGVPDRGVLGLGAPVEGLEAGIGVLPLTHRLGVFLSSPAMRQKSDCFQSRASSACVNSSGVISQALCYMGRRSLANYPKEYKTNKFIRIFNITLVA